MLTFNQTKKPTPFGTFDNDQHFSSDADSMVVYVKRKLGDDIMTVELTSKQIWANFEDATFELSKQLNAHQAMSYMSNLMGISTGSLEGSDYKKNSNDQYVDVNGNVLTLQDITNPDFVNNNTIENTTVSANPIPELFGPHGKENLFPRETLEYLIRRAEPYAEQAGVGGAYNALSGSIQLETGRQDYDLYEEMKFADPRENSGIQFLTLKNASDPTSLFNENNLNVLPHATPQKMRIYEVYHFSPQAAYRFFDTTSAINYLNNQFSFESFTPETVFYVLPVFEDLLRAGQLDISNRVRRSNYSYKIQGSKLRIFPKPTSDNPMHLFFRIGFPADPFKPSLPYDDESINGVSNLFNIPFGNIKYKDLNSMARVWIKQYTLALCKETLGLVRSKFSNVPIPGSDLQMNGSDLISQGKEEKDRLLTNLKDTLDGLTYQKLLEADSAQSEQMMNILKRVPIPNGRVIIVG
jgi:hypothetical protein